MMLIMQTILVSQFNIVSDTFAQTQNSNMSRMRIPGSLFDNSIGMPVVTDPKLKVEVVTTGLEFPTTISPIGDNDFLILEKAKGTISRITDGKILPNPLLKINVASQVERGMLGIAVSGNTSSKLVYVYLTEPTNSSELNKGTVSNRLYRYELVDEKLVNPKLMLDLPGTPGPRHNGGAIIVGPDNNIYVPIGDVDGHTTEAQNILGIPPDGSGGILRISPNGSSVQNILGEVGPAKKYYAYGIRNSFGLDFDPISGKLWDTENGAGTNDEINLVEPGFNSGWLKVQGKAPPHFDYSQLVNFGGKGKYRDPEFSWIDTAGPTKIKFLNSDKLGKEYENDMFVSDVHHGRIYHFKLNETRDGLVLSGKLADKIADFDDQTKDLIFGSNFGGISDMTIGYDGYLYVVSFGRGTVYRIVPIAG
ncbi:MAG: PQQ-dependent sugar dehydrogenase [Nitrososphaeraceae archaeon]